MKSFKRFLAVMLSVTMVLSLTVFAAEFKDVEKSNQYEEAITLLSDLGVINGYDDGTFKPDKEVTRAEMTTLLMRMLGLSKSATEEITSYYTDTVGHWAVYDINTATDRKVINGYGNGIFGPENPVTYEQAVKMIVCMLGFEFKATDEASGYTGWPNGYMRVAREEGLTRGAEMNQTEPAPRKIIAQLLNNALEVRMMEKIPGEEKYKVSDQTLLKTYLKYEKISGKVIANSKTRLDNTESIVKDDEIVIETNSGVSYVLKIGNKAEAVDMLGLDVVVYTKMDDNNINRIIYYINTVSEVTELVVNAEDITSFDPVSTILSYEINQSGKLNNIDVPANAKYIYNDKYIDKASLFANNLQIPQIGNITLVNSGAGYNLVKITSYKNYIVKTVDTNNSKIFVDSDLASVSEISVPYKNVLEYTVTILKNGSSISMNSIRKGNVISVKESHSSQISGIKIMEILVSDTKVSGKIESVEEDSYIINSKEYKVAKSLGLTTAGNTLIGKMVYNASGTFYLDTFGKIANIEYGVGETYKHAYLIKAAPTSTAGETGGAVKLFNASSKSASNYTLAPNVKINGQPYTASEAVSATGILASTASASNLDATKGYPTDRTPSNYDFSQPIQYMLDNNGRISEIITGGSADFAAATNYSSSLYTSGGFTYNSNKYFKAGGNNIYVDSSTIVYIVPADRYSDTKNYSVQKISYFDNDVEYFIEAYGTTSSGNAAAVIVLYDINKNADVNFNSPIIVVNEIKDKQAADGYVKKHIMGYNFISGAEVTYAVENDSYVGDLTKGDVIRVGLNSENEINDKIYKYLDVSGINDGTNFGYVPSSALTNDDAEYYTPSKYPFRFLKTGNAASSTHFYYYNPDITNRSSTRTFLLATPMSVTDEDSNATVTFTDSIAAAGDDMTSVTTAAYIVKSNVKMFVYDKGLPENNRLIYVPASDTEQKMSYMLGLKTYEIAPTGCDYVYLYGSGDSLQTIVIIKK